MHIHTSSMNLNAASLVSTVAAEKAVAAQRAADVRRKLSDASIRLQAEPGEEIPALAPWTESGSERRRAPYDAPAPRPDRAATDEPVPPPFSLWA